MSILLLNIPYWKQQKGANTLIVSSVKWVIPTKGTGKSAFLLTVSFSSPCCSIGESKREKNVHRDIILLRTCWNQAIHKLAVLHPPQCPGFHIFLTFSPLSFFPQQLFIMVSGTSTSPSISPPISTTASWLGSRWDDISTAKSGHIYWPLLSFIV